MDSCSYDLDQVLAPAPVQLPLQMGRCSCSGTTRGNLTPVLQGSGVCGELQGVGCMRGLRQGRTLPRRGWTLLSGGHRAAGASGDLARGLALASPISLLRPDTGTLSAAFQGMFFAA